MDNPSRTGEMSPRIVFLVILVIVAGTGLFLYGFLEAEKVLGLQALAVDAHGDVYLVCDCTLYKLDATGRIVLRSGREGEREGMIGPDIPLDMAVDRSGNIHVADIANFRIQTFDREGRFVSAFGTPGTGPGQLGSAFDIDVDADGYIYVAEPAGHRLQKFDPQGKVVFATGTRGSGNGMFNYPQDPLVGADGSVYVCDYRNALIQRFAADGTFIAQYRTRDGGHESLDGEHLRRHHLPCRMTRTADNRFFILNYDSVMANGYLFEYDADFHLVREIDLCRTPALPVDFPSHVDADPSGTLYVCQYGDMSIHRIGPQGDYLGEFGGPEIRSILAEARDRKARYRKAQRAGKILILGAGALACVLYARSRRHGSATPESSDLVRRID